MKETAAEGVLLDSLGDLLAEHGWETLSELSQSDLDYGLHLFIRRAERPRVPVHLKISLWLDVMAFIIMPTLTYAIKSYVLERVVSSVYLLLLVVTVVLAAHFGVRLSHYHRRSSKSAVPHAPPKR